METGVYPKSKVDFPRIYSDFISGLGENSGSATSFLGVARRESADGTKRIRTLVMESYERHANAALKKICGELQRKHSLTGITIIHALGKFSPGEPVVFVGLSSSRRGASFRALREAVERYKKEPALFKQEIYEDGGSEWVH